MILTLIGTAHFDFKGYFRLTKILHKLNPEVIGIEDTKEDFLESSGLLKHISNYENFEKALINLRKKYPDTDSLTPRLWLHNNNYEVRAIIDYLKVKSVPLVYCDNPEELAKIDFEEQVKNMNSELNKQVSEFLKLTPEQARENIKDEYDQETYPVKDIPSLLEFYTERDKFAEKIIRTEKGNMVYICGLDHIFGDYHPNLYDRLIDLSPKKINLTEIHKLK